MNESHPQRRPGTLALWLAGIVLAAAASAPASAAQVTLSGPSVDFVYDDALLGLFGTPTLSGNSIFFTPTTFVAQSLDGQGLRTTSGLLRFSIVPHAGFSIAGASVLERGDYLLAGAGSTVGVGGTLTVTDAANTAASRSAAIAASAPLTLNDGFTHNWSAAAAVNLLDPVFAATTRYDVRLENLLSAFTVAGVVPSEAFIEKKFAVNALVTSPIPEPSMVAMMLGGLALLGFALRSRSGK